MVKINVFGSCVSRVSLLNGDLKGHGIWGENMQLGYFLDKQNIVSAMMPPAFSDKEIATIRAEELYEPSRIHSLKQCLDKSTMELLFNSNADYVVMDLYDFQNDFGIVKDTTFSTCAHEFFQTELYRKYQNEVKIANFMELPTWIWYPYVDLFFEKLMKKYDEKHIVLIRFRSNTYYYGKDGKIHTVPEEFKKPFHSNDKYNAPLKALEDYIIRKFQPVVIDLAGFYMGDENLWDNLNGAHFELDFYKDVYNCIERIVTGKDLQGRNMMPSFMTENFGKGAEEEKNRKFDIEGALEILPKWIENGEPLWMNLLHKLNIYAPEHPVVKEYTKVVREEI